MPEDNRNHQVCTNCHQAIELPHCKSRSCPWCAACPKPEPPPNKRSH